MSLSSIVARKPLRSILKKTAAIDGIQDLDAPELQSPFLQIHPDPKEDGDPANPLLEEEAEFLQVHNEPVTPGAAAEWDKQETEEERKTLFTIHNDPVPIKPESELGHRDAVANEQKLKIYHYHYAEKESPVGELKLELKEDDSVLENIQGRMWNVKFQEFLTVVQSIGRVIIEEKGAPLGEKRIKPSEQDQSRYDYEGVVYHFYDSDSHAVTGHASPLAYQPILDESAFQRCLVNDEITVAVPLACMVEYRGYRLVCIKQVPSRTKTTRVEKKLSHLQIAFLKAKFGDQALEIRQSARTPAERQSQDSMHREFGSDAQILRYLLREIMEYKDGKYKYDLRSEEEKMRSRKDTLEQAKDAMSRALNSMRTVLNPEPEEKLTFNANMSPEEISALLLTARSGTGTSVSLRRQSTKGNEHRIVEMLKQPVFVRILCDSFPSEDSVTHSLIVRVLWVLLCVFGGEQGPREFASLIKIHCCAVAFSLPVKNSLFAILLTSYSEVTTQLDTTTRVAFYQHVRHRPVWQALFYGLRASSFGLRLSTLQDINTVLHCSYVNARSIAVGRHWQQWILPLFLDIPSMHDHEPYKSMFALTVNIFGQIHFQYLLEDERFVTTVSKTLQGILNFGAYTDEGQTLANLLLGSLLNILVSNSLLFRDQGEFSSTKWTNVLQLVKIIKRFVFQTAYWQTPDEEVQVQQEAALKIQRNFRKFSKTLRDRSASLSDAVPGSGAGGGGGGGAKEPRTSTSSSPPASPTSMSSTVSVPSTASAPLGLAGLAAKNNASPKKPAVINMNQILDDLKKQFEKLDTDSTGAVDEAVVMDYIQKTVGKTVSAETIANVPRRARDGKIEFLPFFKLVQELALETLPRRDISHSSNPSTNSNTPTTVKIQTPTSVASSTASHTPTPSISTSSSSSSSSSRSASPASGRRSPLISPASDSMVPMLHSSPALAAPHQQLLPSASTGTGGRAASPKFQRALSPPVHTHRAPGINIVPMPPLSSSASPMSPASTAAAAASVSPAASPGLRPTKPATMPATLSLAGSPPTIHGLFTTSTTPATTLSAVPHSLPAAARPTSPPVRFPSLKNVNASNHSSESSIRSDGGNADDFNAPPSRRGRGEAVAVEVTPFVTIDDELHFNSQSPSNMEREAAAALRGTGRLTKDGRGRKTTVNAPEFMLKQDKLAKADHNRFFADTPALDDHGLHFDSEGACSDTGLIGKILHLFRVLHLNKFDPNQNNLNKDERKFFRFAARELEFWEDAFKFTQLIRKHHIVVLNLMTYKKLAQTVQNFINPQRSRKARQTLLNEVISTVRS